MFIAHFVLTCAMAGLIWFVQIIHYPLFRRVPAAGFATYEREHTRRAGLLIGPLMLGELATGLALLAVWRPWQLVLATGVLLMIWISTFAIQVPLHGRLRHGLDSGAVRALIRTNWIRTVGWTARALLLGSLAGCRT